jgi:hypothetical protein
MKHAAIVISYARKDNTLRLVEQLTRVGIERIYVSIDGPKNDQIHQIQNTLYSDLKQKQVNYSGKINIWQRELNMGSGASVIASLDWVFEYEDSCIIIEDDLLVTDELFSFLDFGLREMKNLKNLKMVTGTNPFEDVTCGDLGKVNYPVSWGWATNQENWKALRELIFNGAPKPATTLEFRKTQFWKVGRKRALSGQIEAWDVPLASEMYKTNFYTLIPPVNLVSNLGFDQFATHTSESIWPLNLPTNKLGDLTTLDYEEKHLVNLNQEFEGRIFKIRNRHNFTWIINLFVDKFRFKKITVPLIQRCELETFPNR